MVDGARSIVLLHHPVVCVRVCICPSVMLFLLYLAYASMDSAYVDVTSWGKDPWTQSLKVKVAA